MICPKCNADNPDTKQFCGDCGTQLPSIKDIEVTETIEVPKEELTTGSTFAGRYQIIEELGRGGMGRVYKAIDTKIRERVALKLIKPEIAKDKKTIERFSNELKFARKIRHKNVCQMFDLGEEKGKQFITMEFVPGEDLKSSIRRFGKLPIGKSISIAKQICEGLAEAHRLGIIHRDLKPQNVMVDEDGNARIMDFGIARSLEAKGVTGAGIMIGTPEYMSPEQIEGKDVDHRSDIYSLGIILYEMVTGQVPFEGDTPLAIGVKHKNETPKDPKDLNTQIPLELALMILRCLEKDEELRFQDAREILLELTNIEKDLATSERIIVEGIPETKKVDEMEWKNSIAVLPFADLSPQKDEEYFCDGIAEELINALTHIKELRVVARSSAFAFKGEKYDVREIGKKLTVETVLEGSVRKAGNRIRVTAKLINVADGYHLWSERYDRKLEDVFAIQDEVTLAIVDNMKLKLLGEEKERLTKRHTEDLESYNLYLKGRYYSNKRTENDLKIGLDYFNKSIEKDHTYALPYAGLADCYIIMGWYTYLSPKEAFPKAKAAAEKAIKMDKSLVEAHTSLAYLKELFEWNWQEAEKGFKRALELNPNYATAHQWYAVYLGAMGRHDESISEVNRAQELDPLSLVNSATKGNMLYLARKYDQSIYELKKTLEMDQNYMIAHFFLVSPYLQKRMYKEAIAEVQRAMKLSIKDDPLLLELLGICYSFSGRRNEAKKVLDKLAQIEKKRYVSSFFRSLIHLGLRQKNQAIEWLNEAYKERDHWLEFLNVDPRFDSMRDDPKFKNILKKMDLIK